MSKREIREQWVHDVISTLGGDTAVALYLNYTPSAVCQWRTSIPPLSAVRLMIWAEQRDDVDLGLKDFFPAEYEKLESHSEPCM